MATENTIHLHNSIGNHITSVAMCKLVCIFFFILISAKLWKCTAYDDERENELRIYCEGKGQRVKKEGSNERNRVRVREGGGGDWNERNKKKKKKNKQKNWQNAKQQLFAPKKGSIYLPVCWLLSNNYIGTQREINTHTYQFTSFTYAMCILCALFKFSV